MLRIKLVKVSQFKPENKINTIRLNNYAYQRAPIDILVNAYISTSKHIIIAHIRDDIDKFMYHTDCMRAEKNIFL